MICLIPNVNLLVGEIRLGGQPNHGWQLCFPLDCTPVGRTSDSMTVPT